MTTTLIISIILTGIFFYPVFFKQKPFKKELENIRKEQLKKTEQEDKDKDKLYIYLNLIINDKNIKIVRKYFNLFVVGVFFCTASFSQELKLDLENNDFLGSWNFEGSYDAKNSSYSLLIEKDSLESYKFISYKFVSNLDEDGYIYYERQPSPGVEKFVKEENGRLTSTYEIKKQDYFVTVTYGFVDESESLLIATFDGTWKGKPYFNQIEYYKLERIEK